ncbi:hypothetical protein RKD23_000181 [Streptomyces sp. SAI-170]
MLRTGARTPPGKGYAARAGLGRRDEVTYERQ